MSSIDLILILDNISASGIFGVINSTFLIILFLILLIAFSLII